MTQPQMVETSPAQPHLAGGEGRPCPLPDLAAPDVHLTFEQRRGGDRFPSFRLVRGGEDVTGAFCRPVHHSPCGVAWGYAGSGACDLALLVLALHFPVSPGQYQTEDEMWRGFGYPRTTPGEQASTDRRVGELNAEDQERFWAAIERGRVLLPVQVRDGTRVSRLAWELHHGLGDALLAGLSGEQPHVVTAEQVREWLRTQPPFSGGAPQPG